jgi:hypothetical protein
VFGVLGVGFRGEVALTLLVLMDGKFDVFDGERNGDCGVRDMAESLQRRVRI